MRPIGPAIILGTFALAGCAAPPPTGPSVMVMPGKDKSFEAFQADDTACRQYATAQTGGATPSDAASQSFVNSAALGTVLGAAAGAAIGAAAGNPAAGAAIGAGSGLFLGGAGGVGAAQASGASLQRRYDMGYMQCMSAKGEQIPQLAAASPSYPPYPAYYPYYYPYYYGGPSFFSLGYFHGGYYHHHH